MTVENHLLLGSNLMAAIEDKLQHGQYGSVRELATHAEVSSDAQLVIAHALLDIAESLREHLPGRIR